jgi:hypothetical protein
MDGSGVKTRMDRGNEWFRSKTRIERGNGWFRSEV